MKVFQGLAFVVMAIFFVWLLLQMARTPRADQRLIAIALAYVGVLAALGAGHLMGRRR